MKRRVIQLVLLLIAGATVNYVLVCLFILTRGTEKGLEANESDAIPIVFPDGLTNVEGFTGFESRWIGYSHLFVRVSWHEKEGAYKFRRLSGAAWRGGWPLFGLICWKYHFENDESFDCNCITLKASGEPYGILPVRPLWPGFAINTIFYAAILWVVFFVPGKLKRTLRRRHGLCPACAYPIGVSEVCTECGTQLK